MSHFKCNWVFVPDDSLVSTRNYFRSEKWGMTHNVPTLGVRAGFRSTKLSTYHKSPIGKLNLNVSTSPRMTPNVCYAFALLFLSSVSLSFRCHFMSI